VEEHNIGVNQVYGNNMCIYMMFSSYSWNCNVPKKVY